MQVVEGRCADVLRLAARILADPRHGAIRILAFRALPARRYAAWTVSGFDLGAAPEAPPVPRRPTSASCRRGRRPGALERGLPAS